MPFFIQGQMDINPISMWHNPYFTNSTGGFFLNGNTDPREICNLEPWDNTRRDMLILLLRSTIASKTQGDMVEIGVYQGLTAKLIHYYIPERTLHLFDTFEGFTDKSVVSEQKNLNYPVYSSHFSDTSIEHVKGYIAPKNNNVFFYKGYFPESMPDHFAALRFSFIHLDADLYEPTIEALRFFYPRMNERGMIVIHDYNSWPGARKAVDEFFLDKKEMPIPMPDKSGSALIVKQSSNSD
ncbi:MAG: TylF/MycF/NovP-related O-methyltransferase [Bacteroidota bacterium]